MNAEKVLKFLSEISFHDFLSLCAKAKGYKSMEALARALDVSGQNLRRLKKHNPPAWVMLGQLAALPKFAPEK